MRTPKTNERTQWTTQVTRRAALRIGGRGHLEKVENHGNRGSPGIPNLKIGDPSHHIRLHNFLL